MPLISDDEFVVEETAEPEGSVTGAPEFDPKHREDFTGLLYLGALDHKFERNGHTFEIRTLRTEEILAIGQIIKEYEGAVSQSKAYATCLVGACLTRVDGRPLETPFRERTTLENLRYRMDLVAAWYPWIIDVIYSEYIVLENRSQEILDEMGKASG